MDVIEIFEAYIYTGGLQMNRKEPNYGRQEHGKFNLSG